MWGVEGAAAQKQVRVLLDTEVDGWGLWTAYGPGMNERYGSANNSKHYHDPGRVMTVGTGRVLEALDLGAGETKRYRSGCLSTREAPGGAGFFRFTNDVRSLRFEFEVTLSDWNHAVWPACWLRGVGGASVHEIDVLEGFTAQTGTNLYRFALHSAGQNNVIRDPWPGTPLEAGERATVWAEVHRPGTRHPTLAWIRAGKNDTVTVNEPDPRTALWWADDYGWDLIVQQQIGGNWVGDPDAPYAGFLQNGQPGRPVNEIPTWSGFSSMTVHRVAVTAVLDVYRLSPEYDVDEGLLLSFDSWSTRMYGLEGKANLADEEWVPLSDPVPRAGTGGPDALIGPVDPGWFFYRLSSEPF
ncbi:MAG TPA: hypothetical protein PKE55_01550 [Kiritimatiellia bacterium]|nr:hypothetical protein [Kiritimatiellia bacterium]